MSEAVDQIPRGMCQCGCGRRTELAVHNNARLGYVKGQPYRFVHSHNPPRDPLGNWESRDCGYVTPCRVWLGVLSPSGYARIQVKGRKHNAHRFAYELVHGALPAGSHVDHLCRNPACINVDHLEAVTPAENARRGRATKLTATEAVEIRSLCAQGWVQQDIADAYGVHRVTVRSIERGATWSAPGGVVHAAA